MWHNIYHQIYCSTLRRRGGRVELEVGPSKFSLLRLVTTEYDFTREEGTHIFTYQNAALDIEWCTGEIHGSRGGG